MAEVYRRIGGRKIEKVMALEDTVQAELTKTAIKKGVQAEARLNSVPEVRTGTSYIEVEEGNVDRYVILNDTRGYSAAMTIEYGRDATANNAGHEGLWILHDTFGLAHE